MDNNTAVVIVAGLSVVSTLITAGFGYMATQAAKVAAATSAANSAKLAVIAADVHTVEKATNSMLAARIEEEKKLSIATSEVARGEGRDEERIKQEDRATALLADKPATQEVNVVEAVPISIKKDEKE